MKLYQTDIFGNETLVKDFDPKWKKITGPKDGFIKGGMVIYKGPSAFDGAEIVVIATGMNVKSANEKTGDMVQTWIIKADEFPMAAKVNGNDLSVCGDCKHRRTDGLESCYVNLGQGPRSIYNAYIHGRYDTAEIEYLADIFANFKVRLGSYGDPMAVPFKIWDAVLTNAKMHTGYTHQWAKDTGANDWSKIVMASVDSVEEQELAEQFGYRTFRVRTNREELMEGEIACPASKEAGKVTECAKCGLCAGMMVKAKNIAIMAHGILAAKFLVWKHQMAFEFMKDRTETFNFSA